MMLMMLMLFKILVELMNFKRRHILLHFIWSCFNRRNIYILIIWHFDRNIYIQHVWACDNIFPTILIWHIYQTWLLPCHSIWMMHDWVGAKLSRGTWIAICQPLCHDVLQNYIWYHTSEMFLFWPSWLSGQVWWRTFSVDNMVGHQQAGDYTAIDGLFQFLGHLMISYNSS